MKAGWILLVLLCGCLCQAATDEDMLSALAAIAPRADFYNCAVEVEMDNLVGGKYDEVKEVAVRLFLREKTWGQEIALSFVMRRVPQPKPRPWQRLNRLERVWIEGRLYHVSVEILTDGQGLPFVLEAQETRYLPYEVLRRISCRAQF